jgi:hypothetical protein
MAQFWGITGSLSSYPLSFRPPYLLLVIASLSSLLSRRPHIITNVSSSKFAFPCRHQILSDCVLRHLAATRLLTSPPSSRHHHIIAAVVLLTWSPHHCPQLGDRVNTTYRKVMRYSITHLGCTSSGHCDQDHFCVDAGLCPLRRSAVTPL